MNFEAVRLHFKSDVFVTVAVVVAEVPFCLLCFFRANILHQRRSRQFIHSARWFIKFTYTETVKRWVNNRFNCLR